MVAHDYGPNFNLAFTHIATCAHIPIKYIQEISKMYKATFMIVLSHLYIHVTVTYIYNILFIYIPCASEDPLIFSIFPRV